MGMTTLAALHAARSAFDRPSAVPSVASPRPDARGHFGPYGGRFVSETLMKALDELDAAYARYRVDPDFIAEVGSELAHFVGRPSPIYHARRWSERLGGAQIWLKREDLNHTGAHKINNTIGQALLARRMGKPRVIAETGAGQHGVATATVAARFGMECVVSKLADQSRSASLMASLSPRPPLSTGTTRAPSSCMRKTFSACRSASCAPM